MTPERIRVLGEALYGLHWRARMAEELGVTRRTVGQWLVRGVPDLAGRRIEALARLRWRALGEAIGEIGDADVE